MRPNQHNPVHSPYVVVLGGNSVRRKGTSTSPPDALTEQVQSPTLYQKLQEPEAPQVYGVLPPLVSMKTMAQDLKEVKPIPSSEVEKKAWWNFRKASQTRQPKKENITPHQNPRGPASGEEKRVEALVEHSAPQHLPQVAPVHHVIDVPTETEHTKPSPYRGRFLRGIAKKGYLTSKLAVQLPFHAKVGMAVTLLVLMVGVPVASRFIGKPAPVTAGTVVAVGTDALVAQVGKSIELPFGESPLVVLATADDIRRLNVPDSKPGNKILIYQNTGKIVVYDAEKDVVLGVVNRAQP